MPIYLLKGKTNKVVVQYEFTYINIATLVLLD